MKVIDKRRKTDEWHVGDVICFKSYGQNFKDFGMIVQLSNAMKEQLKGSL